MPRRQAPSGESARAPKTHRDGDATDPSHAASLLSASRRLGRYAATRKVPLAHPTARANLPFIGATLAFDRIRALIGIGRASDPSGAAMHGPPRRDVDHTRALPFSESMIATVTADREARLARWAADPEKGWTIRTVRPPEIRLRHWRHPSAIENWKAIGERCEQQRVEAEGLTEAIAVRKLRTQIRLAR